MRNSATISITGRSARCCSRAETSLASRHMNSSSPASSIWACRVRAGGESPDRYQKLLTAVGAGVTVSDKDISAEVKRQDTKVKFEYAVLTLDDIKKQIKPTDAELKAFYEQNKQQYANSIPEKIKAKYILIDTTRWRQGAGHAG